MRYCIRKLPSSKIFSTESFALYVLIYVELQIWNSCHVHMTTLLRILCLFYNKRPNKTQKKKKLMSMLDKKMLIIFSSTYWWYVIDGSVYSSINNGDNVYFIKRMELTNIRCNNTLERFYEMYNTRSYVFVSHHLQQNCGFKKQCSIIRNNYAILRRYQIFGIR